MNIYKELYNFRYTNNGTRSFTNAPYYAVITRNGVKMDNSYKNATIYEQCMWEILVNGGKIRRAKNRVNHFLKKYHGRNLNFFLSCILDVF